MGNQLNKKDKNFACNNKCIICGEKAYYFWPVINYDTPFNPYCKACLEKIEKNQQNGKTEERKSRK